MQYQNVMVVNTSPINHVECDINCSFTVQMPWYILHTTVMMNRCYIFINIEISLI